jgi:uncharacterized coiled-coil protein SlyX
MFTLDRTIHIQSVVMNKLNLQIRHSQVQITREEKHLNPYLTSCLSNMETCYFCDISYTNCTLIFRM